MENIPNYYLKFAETVAPVCQTIVDNVQNAIDCVLKTFAENEEKEFMVFSDYIPATIKKIKTAEAESFLSVAQKGIAELKSIKNKQKNPKISIPNPALFDFISDGGIVLEVLNIFGFYEQKKSMQPYNDYLISIKRYLNEITEIIKLGNDPDYYKYIKDNAAAKF